MSANLLSRADEAKVEDHWIGSRPPATQLAAFLFVGTVPLIFAGIQPTVLRALVHEHRLSAAMTGRIAATEFLFVGLGVGLSGLLFRADRLRLRGALASAALAAIDLAAMPLSGLSILADRAAAGLAEGVLVWLTASLIARASTPARWTGIYSICQSAAQFVAAFALPVTLMKPLGANGAYLALGAAAVAALAACLALPSRLGELHSRQGRKAPAFTPASAGSLASVFLALAAFVGLFAYFGQLADQSRLTSTQEALTSALVVGIGIIGNATAAALARRVSYFAAALTAVPATLVALAMFARLPHFAGFTLASLVFGFEWGFFTPFLVPLVIDADPSRRTAALIPGVQCLGAAAGPLLCSFFVDDSDGRGALAVGATSLAASFAIGSALRLHQALIRRRPQTAAAH